MERTEYFNHTRPSQTQLNNTEDTKILGMIRRMRSTAQMGIRTGFRVIVNGGDSTLIDVGPGEGYTGGFYQDENIRGDYSGERISTLTDSVTGQVGYVPTVQGQALASYLSGALNYVCLLYTETTDTPLAERYYPFTTRNTLVRESFLVTVLTEAQWDAFTADQLANRVLIAIVTAQGAGNALSAANIQQVVQPKNHPTTSQPSTITGVNITSISQDTLVGTGTLRFEASTGRLYWTSPGDAEGIGTAIPDSGTYTLYSSDTTYWIEVETIFASLPIADTTESISVRSLYGRTIPLAGAMDQAHRDMIGGGQPTTNNPHGTTLDDLPGATFDHADLFHVNGISGDAEDDQLECVINGTRIEITNNGGFRNTFLVDGLTYEVITGVAIGTDALIEFNVVPANASGRYIIYVDSAGEQQIVNICQYTPGGIGDFTTLWSANIRVVDAKNQTAGNGTITWNNVPGAHPTLTWQAPGDVAAGTAVRLMTHPNIGFADVEGYYKLYSQNTDNWIIVYVSGALGGANASTFYIAKNETTHPDEGMLKLACVTWNTGAGWALFDATVDDLRRFNTADNREALEEEHNEDGHHTKVLQNALRVFVDSEVAIQARASETAIVAQALDETAIAGFAASTVIDATALVGGLAVRGRVAGDTAGYFSANVDTGCMGVADSFGVFGSATEGDGVHGTAKSSAIHGVAKEKHAGFFTASSSVLIASASGGDYAIRGLVTAGNFGIYGRVSHAAGANLIAIYGTATNHGVGQDNLAVGVQGQVGGSDATGVYGRATHANDGTGVVGIGPTYGVYGTNAAATAGFFTAGGDTGCMGEADNRGVVGSAAIARGVFGIAANYGVYGSAGNIGVYGTANNAGATGIWAHAGGIAAAIGLLAQAPAAGGVGIRAEGLATGLYIADGVLRYDEDDANIGVSYTNLPIVLANGNTYRLIAYQPA